jgi:hypothetical protein
VASSLAVWGFTGPALALFFCLVVASALLRDARPGQLNATLSVPELLMDVMDAFKLELFPVRMWTTDFSSATAVKGDKITAHIAVVPTTAVYDPVTGFANAATPAENLLQDVSVTLNQFRHCPVVVKFLSQLSSKMPLYKECARNTGFALAKYVMDYGLSKVTLANFTSVFGTGNIVAPANFNLDQLELVRTQCNTQKMAGTGRFGILSSAYAQTLQNDDRVKSALFYATLNGDRGYRVFRNICGFEELVEYPDLPTATGTTIGGFFGDRRAVVIATRQVDFANAAAAMGVPQIMQFTPISDPGTELSMTAASWQAQGTGDVYFSPALLFDVSAGNAGGTAGTGTDFAGLVLKTA